jgi:hypothetical protein
MRNKFWSRGLSALTLGVLLSAPVSAATIFGTLTQKGKPIAKAHLTLSCAALEAPLETQTDDRGSYHFSLKAKGNCKLSYQNGSVQAQADVVIDPNPTQYDFDLDTGAAGARLVRR